MMAESSVWLWKEEPLSPPLFTEQDWYNASDNVSSEVEVGEEGKSRAETASQLLNTLDQWVKQEEQFPNWCEERMELPIFEDLPSPPITSSLDISSLKPSVLSNNSTISPSPPSLELIPLKNNNHFDRKSLQNFNQITLKTPTAASNIIQKTLQSLNRSEEIMYLPSTQMPVPLAIVQVEQSLPQASLLMSDLDFSLNTNHDTLTPPDSPKENELQMLTMLQEMQPEELDELVRLRVESLAETPEPSGENSRSSLHEDSESVASPSSESGYSDPEWTMPTFSESKSPKRKRSAKPYTRVAPEEKRQRKKEQNKNAATRYRMKKKQEIEEILSEEKNLKENNDKLKTELTEVQREIKYLKNLMKDVFKAKGLIK